MLTVSNQQVAAAGHFLAIPMRAGEPSAKRIETDKLTNTHRLQSAGRRRQPVSQMQNESRLANPQALTIANQQVAAASRVKGAGGDGRQASHHIRRLAVAGVKRGDLGARSLGSYGASNYVQLGANHAADLAGVVQGCDEGLGNLYNFGAGRWAERV